MKHKLLNLLIALFLLLIPNMNFGQVPDLKTSADFILFASSGGITNTGVSQILGGAIGTDFGALTGFENVNCVKHIADAATEQGKLDLQSVYDEISAIVPTATIEAASLNGATITPGIYQINSAVALTINLTLDAQNDPDALFIFKMTGAFSAAASISIILLNGASVNNIFWHGTAAIGAGAGASLKGTFMTNAGAIGLGAGASLEGRALTIVGEVTMSGSTLTGCIMPEATTVALTQPTYWVATGTIEVTAPIGAGISYSIDGADFTNTSGLFTLLTGGEYTVTSKNSDGCISWTDVTLVSYVHVPTLGTAADFILFASSGGITNTGVSQILGGAIGTDFGALTGFENVNCLKHIADAATEQCKLDLQAVYNEISAIIPTATIEAASLNGATITPGIYQINSAVALTINLTLDAQNDPDALFIFKMTGAFSAAASISIILLNGASVNNIFWHGTAAIGAGAGASLKGTFMTNAGAIGLGAGASLEGRALTIVGEVTMSGSTLTGCIMPEATTVALTQPTYWVATGTIEVTAPIGTGISYSIDGDDFTNTSGLFTLLPGGDYTVISKNSDGCISWTDVTLVSYVHVPTLGTAADFILFTSSGGITNTGVSQILGGAIGTDFGALTGFESVNCVKHIADAATEQGKLDLQAVYNEISAIIPTATIIAASLNGATITPGIYQINSAVALTINLTLDAQNDPDALFIFKMTGAFSAAASISIILLNGASVNNIFWHGTAAIGAGAGASLKGTFMTNAGAIGLGAGALLEGRALTVIGEVTMSGSTLAKCYMSEATTVTLTQPTCSAATGTIEITAPLGAGMSYSIDGSDFTNTSGMFIKVPAGEYTVTSKNTEGCLSMTNITLTGFPHPPELGTVTDFVLFTSAGAVGNTGANSFITGGAIGTDFGAITGFETVACEKYIQDIKTAQCKIDLQAAFDEIDAITPTETITAASLSGGTITAGVYHINSAAAISINLTLNAENNPNALFIFKVTGAFSLAASVNILLINGASVNNVFWNVDGAVSAGAGASLKGTFLALAGTISLGDGASLEGRALSIAGAVDIYNSNVSVCVKPASPVISLTQPNCTQNTGSITITSPTAEGMTYRIDYCDFTNTTGIFTGVSAGTYIVTAKNSDGCISGSTPAIITEDSPPITFTGSTNNEWNNSANWNLIEIPGAYCDAVIPIYAVVNISSDVPAECKDLSIGTGAVLTIEAGKTLTVYGTLTNNADITGLIMKSDADGTASLKHNTANVSATFERYLNNADWTDWKDGWHFISSPVAAQAISPNFTVDPETEYDVYTWYEPLNLWANYKNNIETPTWSTANTLNNGQTNISSNFLAGKGYMVAYNSPEVKACSGYLNIADITIQDLNITGTINANRSWHLLGNPFACALTWDASTDWKITNIAGVAKIWNESLQAYSDLTSTPASSIPATNGFMVQASSGTGSLTLPALKRDHSAQAFYKNTESIPRIMLIAGPQDKSSGQQSTVCFIPEATENYDQMYDGEFLPGYAPKFYSISGDFKLSTNSLPSINDEIVIPFGFVKNDASEYSIELAETIEGPMLILSDLKTNTVHKFNSNPVYHFNSQEGDSPNRFLLHFGAAGIGEKPVLETVMPYVSGGYLYLMIPNGRVQLQVFDILGCLLQSKTISGEGLYSQPFNLPSGIYIVSLIGEHKAKMVKVIAK